MTTGRLACMGRGRPDNFQTPPWPVEMLINRILEQEDLDDASIWDPCCGEGRIVNTLHNLELLATGTDITASNPSSGITDFFEADVEFIPYTHIITNPPYSIKDQWLEKCYELGIPFALLLPLSALEGIKRQRMYREHGIEVLMLPRRVNFQTPSGGGSGAHFATAWFTWGFNFTQDKFGMEFLT